MPGRLQRIAMELQVANDITEFVRGKSRVGGNRQIMEPKFCFLIACTNVNMRGFTSFIGIVEGE
jgi:hypothetical protein